MEPRPDPDVASGDLASHPARESVLTDYAPPGRPPERDRVWLHVGLFLATFAAMVFAAGFTIVNDSGAALFLSLTGREPYYRLHGWTARLIDGLLYAVPFLGFLTVHEFGHYFAARWSKLRVSLPYYIPLPFALGTFGAVIRIKEPFRRTRQLFDVGASGPLAGFVAALVVIGIAIVTLPPVEYLLSAGAEAHAPTIRFFLENGIFPERTSPPGGGGAMLVLGDPPLFHALMSLAEYRVPGYELAHYPMLLAAWFGLFFTALNLLPVGQLDGGHIVYAMFGEAVHRTVARVTTLLLMLSGAVGWLVQMVDQLGEWYGMQGLVGGWAALAFVMLIYLRRYFGDVRYALVGAPVLLGLAAAVAYLTPGLAEQVGFIGWLLWSGLILFVIRMDHPPVLVTEPLTPVRRALGWASIVIFLLCFSVQPFAP